MVFIRSMQNAAESNPRNREEVVGKGSGETAGGSPEYGVETGGESTSKEPGAEGSRKAASRPAAGQGEERTPPSDDAPRPPEPISKGVANVHPIQGGEDTVEVALYVSWNEQWEQVRDFLQLRKDDAQEHGGNRGFFMRGGWMFEVLPSGAGSRSGMVASYVVKVAGLQFKLTRSQSPSGPSPNASVRIGSMALMTLGIEKCWQQVKDIIRLFGGTLLQNKLSRVDSCIDMPEVRMEEFATPFLKKQYVCRSRYTNFYRDGNEVNSLSIGKEPRCRIYDKVLEVNARSDADKFYTLVSNRWNNTYPSTSARVEWQIRRNTIKELGIDSVEDWLEKRAGVINYLFGWLRLVDTEGRDFDRRNPDRYKTLPIWETAHQAFLSWANSSVVEISRKKTISNDASPKLLRDMIGGCALSLMAKRAGEWEGIGPFLFQITMEMKRWVIERTAAVVQREFEFRRYKVAVNRPQETDLVIPTEPNDSYWRAWLWEIEAAANGRHIHFGEDDSPLDMSNWDDPRVAARIFRMDNEEREAA